MSALTVALDRRGEPMSGTVFQRLVDAVDDRGPDGRGSWVEGPVGLGYQSLALTPEEVGGTQPMHLGDVVGVFDGRLDNREELAALLGTTRAVGTITDLELLLRAFGTWDAECVDHLIGDFAFAIWHPRARRLFCAHDRLGTRPLHVWDGASHLVVATDLRSILVHPGFSVTPNARYVSEYLVSDFTSQSDTLYESLERLPPAHALEVVNGRVKRWRYWDVELTHRVEYQDDEDYVDHFVEIMTDAVRARMRTRVPPTVSLSGGQDSSLVTGIATSLVEAGAVPAAKVTTTSLVYPGFGCDESYWIRCVAGSLGLDSREIPWAPVTWDETLDAAARVRYLPPYPNATFDTFVRNGVRNQVVLTGSGGDQWMNGYRAHFLELVANRQVQPLLSTLRHGGLRHLLRTLREGVQVRVRPPSADPESGPVWFGPKLRDLERRPPDPGLGKPPGVTRARRQRYAMLHAPWEPHAMEESDRCAAVGDLACTSPFYDTRLVEFALAIDDDQRWRGKEGRWLERRTLRRFLPPESAERSSEAEFTEPFVAQAAAAPTRAADAATRRGRRLDRPRRLPVCCRRGNPIPPV